MSVADKLKTVFEKLPDDVKLIAISKTKSTGQIMQVYHTGHRVFGESKAQELLPKYEALPKDIRWHMVGHLQSNKVKYIAPFIELIHSIDSLKLLKVVNKEARKNMRIIQCLLQIHIAQEESKYGLQFEEACEILESESFRNMENVEICGLMGMATLTGNTEKVRSEFRQLKRYFDLTREKYFAGKASFKEISMGMSGDYELAIEEGSTMVRIGSAIFGERED